jgi:hypothetical protein
LPGTLRALAKDLDRETLENFKPHEFLRAVAAGMPIRHKQWKVTYDKDGVEVSRHLEEFQIYPDILTRIDCAKACAPYFAPRLVAGRVETTERDGRGVIYLPVTSLQTWTKDAQEMQKKLISGTKKGTEVPLEDYRNSNGVAVV